jgi:hypothetical protein
VYTIVIFVEDNGRFSLQRRTDFDVWRLQDGVLGIDEDNRHCTHRKLMGKYMFICW